MTELVAVTDPLHDGHQLGDVELGGSTRAAEETKSEEGKENTDQKDGEP